MSEMPKRNENNSLGDVSVRATLRLRNDAMLKARERLGITQAQLAQLVGVSVGMIGALERFDFSYNPGSILQSAERVAGALDLPRDAIVPEDMIGERFASTHHRVFTANLNVLAEQQRRLVLPSPVDQIIEQEAARDTLADVMKRSRLTSRERRIIELRFGLPPHDHPHSLQECGDIFQISRERTRQLESNAMSALRRHANQKAVTST